MTIDPDSLIFDMDGTMWDAVDSYCTIWNTTFDELGIPHRDITRSQLMALMGKHLEDIVAELAHDVPDHKKFLECLDRNERTLMPRLSGKFYPELRKTVTALARGRRLFMVSNCGSHGLTNFITLAGITPYITLGLSHGATGCNKTANIARLIDEYALKSPYYVGDTQGDSDAAHAAGAKMIFCAYGFGTVSDPDIVINSFSQLSQIITLH